MTAPVDAPAPRRGGSPPRCAAIQATWLAGELWVGAVAAYVVGWELLPWLLADLGMAGTLLVLPLLAVAGLIAYVPVTVLWAVLVKRLLIGRYRPAREPVWGGFYTRHWIVTHTARHVPWDMLAGTVFAAVALRALGARVGQRVHVHRGVELADGGWDLLELGDDVTLAQDASIRLTELEDGHLVVGPVRVGAGATVDTRAGLSPGSTLGEESYLTALSWLPPGTAVPPGACWDGVPAGPAGAAPPTPTPTASRVWSPVTYSLAQMGAVLGTRLLGWLPLTVAVLLLARMTPGAADRLLAWLWGAGEGTGSAIALLVLPVLMLPASLTLQALALRLTGPVPRGILPRWGPQALRVWAKTGAVAGAERWLSGSMFWPPWLRLAGMHVGRQSEVSTLIDTLPETVTVGDESFFADGIYFCQPRQHRGTVTVTDTRLGDHTFLGNHAVVPAGHTYPDDYFVGVSTVADAATASPGSDWFGHPPMALPRRAVMAADRRLTYEPDALRFATRLVWELARFTLPVLPWALALVWLWALGRAEAAGASPLVLATVVAPVATAVVLAIQPLAVVALKWLLLGRVKAGQHAFWSCWCGRWDFLYVAWSQWARGVLAQLEGTLLLNAFLRLTGMRIGRHVVLGAGFAQVVDPDMLHFEDDATVNCHFQAHSFEDRILKIGPLFVRRGATVGRNAVLFYGADIGPGAQVAPHSVVMKGDVLPGGRAYAGHPASTGRSS